MLLHKTLRDLVYDYISAQIREGSLNTSSMIRETDLSAELGVSRTPVREALIQLASDGLLDNIPHRGFKIKPIDEKSAKELLGIIGQLEGYAAKLATKLLTRKDVDTMQLFIEAMDLAINHGDVEQYLKEQDSFHDVFLRASGNAVLHETITKLKRRLYRRGHQDENQVAYLENLNLEHRRILELFKEQDADGVSAFLIKQHWSPEYGRDELFL
ncbi:MAG TPA: GntR family transcriptional regulator [Bacillota bacterium]|nr:GntR family transcriptional regulator [Bacillota bacterium]